MAKMRIQRLLSLPFGQKLATFKNHSKKGNTGFPENSLKQNWLSKTAWLSENSFNERLSKTHANPGKALACF